jgi:FlaA1/EpsC-like NDP-sugar epimerase
MRTLIVGAGVAGRALARDLSGAPEFGLEPIGFLDDDTTKRGIPDLPVLGSLAALTEVAIARRVDVVVLAIPRLDPATFQEVAASAAAAGASVRYLPSFVAALERTVVGSDMRWLDVGRLIGRDEVHVVSPEARTIIHDRVVLVTGAGGSIGSELCRQVFGFGPRRLVMLDHDESNLHRLQLELWGEGLLDDDDVIVADIRDRERIDQIFTQVRPDVVFHAAAHKHLPLLERHPCEAVKSNIRGTENVLWAAIEHRAERFILISTDKAADPSSVLGASKRLAEVLVQQDSGGRTKLASVRFGNVLGSRGSVVPIFKQQIERGGPLTITHPDVQRYFMTIPEAVQLVLQAGGLGRGGEVFVLNMGPLVKVADLAQDLVRLSGLDPQEIPVVFTGLRPGEKLIEELWEDDAQVVATTNRDLFSVIERSRHEAQSAIAETFAAVATWDWPQPALVGRLVDVCRQMIANGRTAGNKEDSSTRFPDAHI